MISVCLATYNGNKFIREQLVSILTQLGPHDEIIISDDGSTDNTLAIISGLNDDRIRILKHHRKRNYPHRFDFVTHNFENALYHASGDFIFLSDQDDVWLPGKVDLMQKELKNHLLVLSDCKVADASLHIIHNSYFKLNGLKKGVMQNLIKNSFLGSCMAFRRDLLQKALPFPQHSVPHDIWLGMLACHYGKVAYLSIPLMIYRRHEATVSASGSKSPYSIFFKLLYRWYCMTAYLKRISTTNNHNT